MESRGQPRTFYLVLIAVTAISLSLFSARGQDRSRPDRVAHPDWKEEDFGDIFFENAFQQGLVGDRDVAFPTQGLAASADGGAPTDREAPHDASQRTIWSQWIAASVLEDEVKAVVGSLQRDLLREKIFTGGTYRAAQARFSLLAQLWWVIDAYDGEVRWKSSARAASADCARLAQQLQRGTAAEYRLAVRTHENLQGLLQGTPWPTPESTASTEQDPSRSTGDWSALGNRPVLMRRMEHAWNRQLRSLHAEQESPAKNTKKKKNNNKDNPVAEKNRHLHEAQIVAVLSEMLRQPGMPDDNDESYTQLCCQLRDAARQILTALQQAESTPMEDPSRSVQSACDDCHDSYR